MKKVLAILVVIVFVASLASAQSFSYQPTKNGFLEFDANANGLGIGNDVDGNQAQQRAGKGWQNIFILDFNRAQIQSDVTAALGHTFTAADVNSGAVVVTLSEMASDDWGAFTHTAAYTPAYFTSTTNWTESGACYNYADLATQTTWNGFAGDPGVVNTGSGRGTDTWGANISLTQGTAQIWSAPSYTYDNFSVDANVASGYLFATAAGDAIEMSGNDYSNNGTVYGMNALTQGRGGTYAGPVLTVTVVPEPMTLRDRKSVV